MNKLSCAKEKSEDPTKSSKIKSILSYKMRHEPSEGCICRTCRGYFSSPYYDEYGMCFTCQSDECGKCEFWCQQILTRDTEWEYCENQNKFDLVMNELIFVMMNKLVTHYKLWNGDELMYWQGDDDCMVKSFGCYMDFLWHHVETMPTFMNVEWIYNISEQEAQIIMANPYC